MLLNRKYKNFLILASVSLLSLAMIIVAVEMASKAIVDKKFARSEKPSITEFISKRPLPFSGVEDFDIVANTQFGTQCPPERIVVKANGFPKYEAENINCDGEKVINGLRRTTDQPAVYQNEIHIFGGSTTWGTGSSDRYTIPSILQRLLNEKYPNKYKVINHGFSGVVAKQELAELKVTKIKSGDIAIFYDGGNDVWQGVVYGKPEGTIIGYNDKNKWGILINKIKFFMSSNSYFYRLLALIKSKNPSQYSDQCKKSDMSIIKNNSEMAYAIYSKSLAEANDYARMNGAVFIHFFQPTLFSRTTPFSEYEMSLISQSPSDMIPCGTYEDALQKGYSYFKDKYQFREHFTGFDLTEVLNPTEDHREYFFDWIHVSSAANEKIARAIYDSVFEDHH